MDMQKTVKLKSNTNNILKFFLHSLSKLFCDSSCIYQQGDIRTAYNRKCSAPLVFTVVFDKWTHLLCNYMQNR